MNGLLVIDKPAGLTSHDVISRVRHTLHERRVGHTGTLDPFATGVLLVLVGRSTRLAQFFSGDDKQYEAIIRLGYATTTGDRTGDPLSPPGQLTRNWSEDEIESAMASLRGNIDQVPPITIPNIRQLPPIVATVRCFLRPMAAAFRLNPAGKPPGGRTAGFRGRVHNPARRPKQFPRHDS